MPCVAVWLYVNLERLSIGWFNHSCVRIGLSLSSAGVCMMLLKVSPLLACSIYSPGSCLYPTWCKLDGMAYSKVLKATQLVIKSHCVYCICHLLNKFIAVFKVVVLSNCMKLSSTLQASLSWAGFYLVLTS